MTQEPGVDYTKDDLIRFQMIAKLCKGTVLDVGAGDGKLGDYLSPCHFYTAVDENPRSPHVQYGDIYNLDFNDWEFNTVVLAEVIEHLTHPVDALCEVAGIANKQVIISTPNPFNTDQIASVFRHGYNIENPNHVALYGDNEIKALCKQACMGKVTVHRFYTRVPGLRWLSPIKSAFGEWNIYVVEV